ncbi:MAG: hypothetical protein HYY77_02210 [Betaproteobacteria bacterium]|nr:hypothetical protein [Betaproteobacteria bacterium]
MQNPIPDKVGRTFICSIVFLDIVEYSTQTVAKQLALKGWLNDILSQALKSVSEVDRIILDTGDGVAMCFLGDPEEALFVSNNIRVALNEQHYPGLVLRTGINLGPVKLVMDINRRPNIIGDGINVAQRVMSFADPNQILVSRSYYEVVVRLSDDYTKLFEYHDIQTFGSGPGRTAAAPPPPVAAAPPPLSPTHTAKSAAPPPPVAAAPPPPAPAAQPAAAATVFPDELLAALGKQLARYLGPIATFVVAKGAKKAATLDELRQVLADMIPVPVQREHFLQEMGSGSARAIAPANARTASPPAPQPAQSKAAGDAKVTNAGVPALEQLLATCIGPMAKILVAKAMQRARNDDALISQLAEALDNERDRSAFLTAAADIMASHKRASGS